MCAHWIKARPLLALIAYAMAAPALAQSRFPHGGNLPIYGLWANSQPPAASAAAAGFDWFETGYPGQGWNTAANATLRSGNSVPLAYINVGELDPNLSLDANYQGPIIAVNPNGNMLVDVTDPSWQSWILRRVDQAMSEGSGGIKWDIADPAANDDPPSCSAFPSTLYATAKSRTQVNDALANIYSQVRARHPGIVMVHNQGFKFACAYPQYVNGFTTEGLFTARSAPGAYLRPWLDPFYWGPQYSQCVTYLQPRSIPCIDITEDVDPNSQAAVDVYGAATAKSVAPYIVNDPSFQQKGRALYVPAGWPPWCPYAWCGTNCVNLIADANNCGACGVVCGAGPVNSHPACAASTCSFACNSGYSQCGSSCVDLHGDPNNCGACGNQCCSHCSCSYNRDRGTAMCVNNW